ncbi:hypothetical protein EJB05_55025, partial [Eragrostis curvula]
MDPMIGVAGGLNDYSRVIVLAGERYEDALRRLEKRKEMQRLAILEREARERRYAAEDRQADVASIAAAFGAQRFLDVPACSVAILALPMPTVGETAERGCALCGELFKEGDLLRMMPCSHSFHQICTFRRLRVNGTCPCCHFAMPAAEE